MSSMVPSEACVSIANSIEEFIHHKREWQSVLENIQDTINTISTNVYAVGYYDGKNGKPENPLQVDDWQWQLQIRSC